MSDIEATELVGVPGVHGIGLVRRPMRFSRTPRKTVEKVFLGALPVKKPTPPTFKGTHSNQLALPRDDKTIAWKWNGKTWLLITRAEADRLMKATGEKVVAPSAPAPAVKPVAPAKPPSQPGKFVGQSFLPSDKNVHAWLWDGAQWRGVSRSDALNPQATFDKLGIKVNVAQSQKNAATAQSASLLDKIVAAVTPNSASAADVSARTNAPGVVTGKPPAQPGRFIGEAFLPSNPKEHAWKWNGKQWVSIPRSAALVQTTAEKQAQADYALDQKQSFANQVRDAVTGAVVGAGHAEQSLFDKVLSKLKPPTLLPHPDVPVITGAPGSVPDTHPKTPGTVVPPVTVPSTAGPQRLPTALDPDADGQMAPGVPTPPPTVGKPGTFPSTARDPNGDGIEDATGRPAPKPTVGVPGTFPSTALDQNGDGIIDSTGQPSVPPLLGQKGSFPATPDDADGDGINDTTGKPLNANGASGMSGLLLPIAAGLAVLVFATHPGKKGL